MPAPTANAPALMFYDGLCGFCNASVQWLLKHDRHDRFRFAPQQSAFASQVLARHGIDQAQMIENNSVYLVMDLDANGERVLQRSDVTVQCLFSLGGIWKILGYAFQIVPKVIRDAVYAVTAKNRFRLAGKYDVCPMPSAEQRAKFLGV